MHKHFGGSIGKLDSKFWGKNDFKPIGQLYETPIKILFSHAICLDKCKKKLLIHVQAHMAHEV